MSRIPEYVSLLKYKGEIAQYRDGNWILVKKTSRRIPGKQTPEIIYIDMAIATTSGRVELSNVVHPDIGNFTCYEFGYSYSVLQICPPQWKSSLGKDWEAILLDMVIKLSPTSYLTRSVTDITLPTSRFIGTHQDRFWKKLPEGTQTLLEPLKRIQLVVFPDNKLMISQPDDEQQSILSRLNINIKGCVIYDQKANRTATVFS